MIFVNQHIMIIKIILNSDGTPQRDFIHSSDICNALELIIQSKITTNNIFNIASGKTFTILELAKIVKKVYEEKYKKEIMVKFSDNSGSLNSKLNNGLKKYKIDITKN